MRVNFRTLCIWSIALFLPASCFGQAKKVFEDKFVLALDSLFDDWNERLLRLPSKSELQDQFFMNLEQRVKERPGGYEDEKWRAYLRQNWEVLPQELTPRLRLSSGARLVLIGGFVDNLDRLKEQKVEPTKLSVLHATELALFIVLGWSQQGALSRHAPQISSDYVRAALEAFFTGVYPFCQPGPPPPPPPPPKKPPSR